MRSVMIWPLRFEHRPMETSLYLRRRRRELTSAQPNGSSMRVRAAWAREGGGAQLLLDFRWDVRNLEVSPTAAALANHALHARHYVRTRPNARRNELGRGRGYNLGRGVERKQLDGRLHVAHHLLEGREAVAVLVDVGLVTAGGVKLQKRRKMSPVVDLKRVEVQRRRFMREGSRTLHQHT